MMITNSFMVCFVVKEMASISAFMAGGQRPYPAHYMETSISTYVDACRYFNASFTVPALPYSYAEMFVMVLDSTSLQQERRCLVLRRLKVGGCILKQRLLC
jgi:hypothetical protein